VDIKPKKCRFELVRITRKYRVGKIIVLGLGQTLNWQTFNTKNIRTHAHFRTNDKSIIGIENTLDIEKEIQPSHSRFLYIRRVFEMFQYGPSWRLILLEGRRVISY
jgi:hypothetical protein